MKARLEYGDVFVVPLDKTRAGIGQVVATYGQGAFYFAIYDLLVNPAEAEAQVDKALAADLLFLAPSLDSRLPVPYLTVIASRPVRPGLPLPAHREVDAENLVQVVDFSGRRRRRATDEEARRLQNRRFVAPLRLARALRATAGMEPWNDTYSALIPDEEMSTERLFGPEQGTVSQPVRMISTPSGPVPVMPSGAIPTSPYAGQARPATGPVPMMSGGSQAARPATGAMQTVPVGAAQGAGRQTSPTTGSVPVAAGEPRPRP
jgi:hypothetical protein